MEQVGSPSSFPSLPLGLIGLPLACSMPCCVRVWLHGCCVPARALCSRALFSRSVSPGLVRFAHTQATKVPVLQQTLIFTSRGMTLDPWAYLSDCGVRDGAELSFLQACALCASPVLLPLPLSAPLPAAMVCCVVRSLRRWSFASNATVVGAIHGLVAHAHSVGRALPHRLRPRRTRAWATRGTRSRVCPAAPAFRSSVSALVRVFVRVAARPPLLPHLPAAALESAFAHAFLRSLVAVAHMCLVSVSSCVRAQSRR